MIFTPRRGIFYNMNRFFPANFRTVFCQKILNTKHLNRLALGARALVLWCLTILWIDKRKTGF